MMCSHHLAIEYFMKLNFRAIHFKNWLEFYVKMSGEKDGKHMEPPICKFALKNGKGMLN